MFHSEIMKYFHLRFQNSSTGRCMSLSKVREMFYKLIALMHETAPMQETALMQETAPMHEPAPMQEIAPMHETCL